MNILNAVINNLNLVVIKFNQVISKFNTVQRVSFSLIAVFVLVTSCTEISTMDRSASELEAAGTEAEFDEDVLELIIEPEVDVERVTNEFVEEVQESPAIIIASPVIEEPIIERWRIKEESESEKQSIIDFCGEIGGKLGSVDVTDCLDQDLHFSGTYTSNNRPIAVHDFIPEGDLEGKTRILIMGGIHGDEYSSISIMFKWMALLNDTPTSDVLWRFVPAMNPDGLLGGKAIRQNANGVDLNRNFPSNDWEESAQKYWKESTGSNPRRYPGEYAASEIEVQWIVNQIDVFQPDIIMSIHAPYHLLDFDGPSEAPERIGELYLHVLGVYPGSLGNYAGINLEIPVVTLELPSAGIMPDEEQIENMWADIQTWLKERSVK